MRRISKREGSTTRAARHILPTNSSHNQFQNSILAGRERVGRQQVIRISPLGCLY